VLSLRFLVLFGGIVFFHTAHAQYKNWFDDPHFVVRSAIAACPVPLGPNITLAERDSAAHGRAERGTTCFLEGRCRKPNAFAYDKEIADLVRKRFGARDVLPDSALWITIQRRWIRVEGCVMRPEDIPTLEGFLVGIDDVERVVVNVALMPIATVPYPVLPSGARFIAP
jgi:hypothetical protein